MNFIRTRWSALAISAFALLASSAFASDTSTDPSWWMVLLGRIGLPGG